MRTAVTYDEAGQIAQASNLLLAFVNRSQDPLREAFMTRALRAVAELVERLESGEIKEAVGARSDYDALLSALSTHQAIEQLTQHDPFAAARIRGIQARANLLEQEGGTLGVAEVGRLLGITRQAVDKRRKAGRLLGLRHGRHGYVYPGWQFGDQGTIAGFEETLEALGDHDPWMCLTFLLNPSSSLGGISPLQALRASQLSAVIRAAKLYGEQSAA